ncbi:MAG: putative transport system permease protein [Candidatus Woesearchaeota archaeon]|nr:putative transport system permease protein [Candidatus Woesearchaeota archaeon]
MILDFFKIAFENINRRKTRAFLTTLSIVISVGSLVALLSLSQGLMNSVENIFEQMGRDKIYITSSPTMSMAFMPANIFSAKEFTDSELSKIAKVDGVEAVSPMTYDKVLATFKDESKLVYLSGIPLGKDEEIIKEMQQMSLSEGKDFEKNDKYKAILGCKFLKGDIFDNAVKLNDKISIKGIEFKVIGFWNCFGNDADDSTIMIPIDVYKELMNKDTYNIIMAKAAKGYNVTKVAEAVKARLRKLRGLKEGEENFQVQTSDDILETFNNIMSTLNILIIALSFVSLIVAGFVIMNSIYISVIERRKEIGILKAIGAKNSDVALFFIIETIIISLIGGAIGLSIGFSISKAAEIIANSALGSKLLIVTLDFRLVLFAFGFSLLLGLFSTLYPAIKAAKLNPVDAIRS